MSNIRSRIQRLENAQLNKRQEVRVFEVNSEEEQERLSQELEGKYPGDLIVFIRKFPCEGCFSHPPSSEEPE